MTLLGLPRCRLSLAMLILKQFRESPGIPNGSLERPGRAKKGGTPSRGSARSTTSVLTSPQHVDFRSLSSPRWDQKRTFERPGSPIKVEKTCLLSEGARHGAVLDTTSVTVGTLEVFLLLSGRTYVGARNTVLRWSCVPNNNYIHYK